MPRKIKKILSTRKTCQECKRPHQNNNHPLQNIVKEKPRGLVRIDYIGRLPTSRGGCTYILVLVDVFSNIVAI